MGKDLVPNGVNNEADLQSAIQGHAYDSQTLEEIILILDHECLCRKSEDGCLGRNITNLLQHRLETSHTDELIVQISACLVRSINPASHYICELQARALVSALALLHAQGVRALQAEFHESLRAQFNSRFQDLLGLPDGSDIFSVEIYRRVQCSYFLCLGAEYAKQFVQARPIVLTVLSRAVSLILVGISIATSVLVGVLSSLNLLRHVYTNTSKGWSSWKSEIEFAGARWSPQTDLDLVH